MVLEELYPTDLLRKHSIIALLLGISYSIVAMGGALFLFPKDPALIAVALTAMLMFPLLRKLSQEEESQEQNIASFRELYIHNKDMFKIYMWLFLGAFIAFAFFSIMLPKVAANFLFKNQLEIYFGSITGNAFNPGLFMHIFNNNLRVLLFCFFMSLVISGGSIFIIAWNASLWGTIFGMLAVTASGTTGGSIWLTFGLLLLIVLPHVILEAASYIFASIAGSILSVSIVTKKFLSSEFNTRLQYNIYLLLIAVLVFVIAAVVETYVIDIKMYADIVKAAFL